MAAFASSCRNAESGAALVEYALLVLFIAIVALAGVLLAGEEVSTQYSEIASAITDL